MTSEAGNNTKLNVPEETYKADLELLTKFQAFSGELLRLSLLGLSVFGVLLKANKLGEGEYVFFKASIICFGICSGFALYHRFFSTEGLMYHILTIRKPGESENINNRNKMYRRSAIGMGIATLFLGIAASLLCIGFIQDFK